MGVFAVGVIEERSPPREKGVKLGRGRLDARLLKVDGGEANSGRVRRSRKLFKVFNGILSKPGMAKLGSAQSLKRRWEGCPGSRGGASPEHAEEGCGRDTKYGLWSKAQFWAPTVARVGG